MHFCPTASTYVHLRPPGSTCVHMCSPASICVHLYPLAYICIHFHPPTSTFVHLHPLSSTCIHMCPPASHASNYIHFCPPASGYLIIWSYQRCVLATFAIVWKNSNWWQQFLTFCIFWQIIFSFGTFQQSIAIDNVLPKFGKIRQFTIAFIATFGNLWQLLATYVNFLQLLIYFRQLCNF